MSVVFVRSFLTKQPLANLRQMATDGHAHPDYVKTATKAQLVDDLSRHGDYITSCTQCEHCYIRVCTYADGTEHAGSYYDCDKDAREEHVSLCPSRREISELMGRAHGGGHDRVRIRAALDALMARVNVSILTRAQREQLSRLLTCVMALPHCPAETRARMNLLLTQVA